MEIMTEELRIKKLEEIKREQKPEMTGVRIPYKGEDRIYSVYKIPLEYLVYNPYNGRIGTRVKTYEKYNHILDPENRDHSKIIEKYLWESREDRNKRTLKSLVKDKQREYGIVSRNGIIIDGNRRASLLNKIYRERSSTYKKENVNHCAYFNAVILDDDADKKEILRLETTYQMGRDEKLDYNAPEKYLKCKELVETGYTVSDIAEMMGKTEANINKYLSILELMEGYLEYHEYDGMYSMLDKREGQFVDLHRYVKQYEDQSGNAKTNWAPDSSDISDMVNISYDYIRALYEGKEFRNIAQTSRKGPNSFFAHKDIWEEFVENHENKIDTVEEDDVDTYAQREGAKEDIGFLLRERDSEWTEKVKGDLEGNLNIARRRLDDYQAADQPLTLLKNALGSLKSVDVKQDSFYNDEEIERIVYEINSMTYEFKKKLKKNNKGN